MAVTINPWVQEAIEARLCVLVSEAVKRIKGLGEDQVVSVHLASADAVAEGGLSFEWFYYSPKARIFEAVRGSVWVDALKGAQVGLGLVEWTDIELSPPQERY